MNHILLYDCEIYIVIVILVCWMDMIATYNLLDCISILWHKMGIRFPRSVITMGLGTTFQCNNSLNLGSMRRPFTFYTLAYYYDHEHRLLLMTSQRVLLSVSGGMWLHTYILQVDFKSGCGVLLLWYCIWLVHACL